jgi:hypothetical protein
VKEQNVDRRSVAVKGPSNEHLDVQERWYRTVAVLLKILSFLAIDEVYELRISRNDDIVPGILDLQDLVYAERLTPLTAKPTSWNVRW